MSRKQYIAGMPLHPLEHTHTVFETELDDVCRRCRTIQIGTAFIDAHAIQKLEQLLSQRGNFRPSIQLLIGIYQRFNRKEHLERLLFLAQKFPAHVDIRISSHERFHWKLYAIEQKKAQFHFFIGSSNFTKSGLNSTGELMFHFQLKITRPQDDPTLYVFHEAFSESTSIFDFDIDQYIERKMPVDRSADKKVKQLIEFHPQESSIKDPPERFGTAFTIQHYATSATVKMIDRLRPEWAKKKWTWYTMTTKADWQSMQRAKYLFNFYKEDRKDTIAVSSYEGRGQSAVAGARYLIAHHLMRTKPISVKLAGELKAAGMHYSKRVFSQKTILLNKRQSELLQQFFKLA